MPKYINQTTAVADRRIHDTKENYLLGRKISCKPGTGECRIKISHDKGATYDTVEIVTAANLAAGRQALAGGIETYDTKMEFECTENAVIALSD